MSNISYVMESNFNILVLIDGKVVRDKNIISILKPYSYTKGRTIKLEMPYYLNKEDKE